MDLYHTAPSSEGLLLPYSGFLIGKVADAMRLKAILREEVPNVSYKTVQRYFRGERVTVENVTVILETIVDALIPRKLNLPVRIGEVQPPVHQLLQGGIRQYALLWDELASALNDLSYPIHKAEYLGLPYLRMFCLDIGIRWGAWAGLRLLNGQEPGWEYDWASARALGNLIDSLRRREGLTVEALADEVQVSPQAIAAWRSGQSQPTNDNLEALSSVLSRAGGGRTQTELSLRFALGLQVLIGALKQHHGERRIQDMLSAMRTTAELVAQWTSFCTIPALNQDERYMVELAVWWVVLGGARCATARSLISRLVEKSKWNQEVAADFRALTGNWWERAATWRHLLGAPSEETKTTISSMLEGNLGDVVNVEALVEGFQELKLNMGGFNISLEERGFQVVKVPLPHSMRYSSRIEQAEREWSAQNYPVALKHIAAAISHNPTGAMGHFKMGAYLGQLGCWQDRPDMMEEGIRECRVAVALDPEFGTARNEIAIIFANMRMHSEAEKAFSEAEPFHNKQAHHWAVRGRNYVALGRYEDAERAFRKAGEVNRGQIHVRSMADLSALLMKLNRKKEARRLGKQVSRVIGFDPSQDWERRLDFWGDNLSSEPERK